MRVVGINREVNNLGQEATTSPSSVPDLARSAGPRTYLIRLRKGADPTAVIRDIRATTSDLITPTVVGISTLPPLIGSIIPVVRSLAGALALLTILGVFNSIYLAVQERRREFGLVRALGMRSAQILGTTVTGAALLAIAASAVAVPVAAIAGRTAIGSIMSQVGIGRLAPPISATVWAVAPLVVVVAILGALGPAWSASRTSVIDVLRAE